MTLSRLITLSLLSLTFALAKANEQENPRFTNRLADEQSPYLLQHQHNPVDWYPWGQEAFEAARESGKPIFLSIGYSTCHWCHVMEKESFENEATARILNDHFINIKLDREERPDIDHIYMSFVQATTGSGGWPLNVFLTHDLKPFFGGTYFPPEPQKGLPSFESLLIKVNDLWTSRRQMVIDNADKMSAQLFKELQTDVSRVESFNEEILNEAVSKFKESFDSRNGGFGGSPKFPQPSVLSFLLDYAKSEQSEVLQMIQTTCNKMAAGGIYDHVGGGFARYSVDAEWRIPHFEKMLYDNAQLIELLVGVYQVTGNPKYLVTSKETANYLIRDMASPEGGFYSAQDSVSEGQEGRFYTWTMDELRTNLPEEELRLWEKTFVLSEIGNFADQKSEVSTPGQNVLIRSDYKLSKQESKLFQQARQKLFEARSSREQPHLDDKVLISWNGLTLSAFAKLYAATGREAYLDAAKLNYQFVLKNMWEAETGTLFHRWRNGSRDRAQLLSAYAFYLNGVVELYQVTLDSEYLTFAIALAESMISRFYDTENGGFWQSEDDGTQFVRVKNYYDRAMPSGNSLGIYALSKLAAITENEGFAEIARSTLETIIAQFEKTPHLVPVTLKTLITQIDKPTRVVIAKGTHETAFKELLLSAHSEHIPNRVVLGNKGPVEPFAKSLDAIDNQPTAYVCVGMACSLPTHDAKTLLKYIGKNK